MEKSQPESSANVLPAGSLESVNLNAPSTLNKPSLASQPAILPTNVVPGDPYYLVSQKDGYYLGSSNGAQYGQAIMVPPERKDLITQVYFDKVPVRGNLASIFFMVTRAIRT
ncbi:hypothetical protein PHO31112_04933 [Pandoraea horticolens]|uniref:Uncharacterized protein n=1 Tax=Pandoraea horticolens TaxID=2508298 RepID=A0A5E4Z1R1_9BURK|nr:hypothetical protein [Pandoraea horticolens]VVE54515.1 hypothetical protein PHO31112_04933 [Pandoraea horticolens]